MREAVGLAGEAESAQPTSECSLLVNGAVACRDRERLATGHRERGAVAQIAAPARYGFVLTAHPVAVESVTYVGFRQTYDLSVDGPWHNFVANGVVVHNSFNEFSLRYAKATDDFYVPEPEDVRTQVGKPGAYTFEPVAGELAERTRDELRTVYEQSYAAYERLVEAGVARELARAVLPVGAYHQFYLDSQRTGIDEFRFAPELGVRTTRDPQIWGLGRDVFCREDACDIRGVPC